MEKGRCHNGRQPQGPTERPGRWPSAPVPGPSNVYKNWAGVDMMYHLDGRRHRQSLVYFGEPQDLSSVSTH